MHKKLLEIEERILKVATAALMQANTHSAFLDPGNEHWSMMSILNTATAGELFLKAIIAKEHPLLIFKDFFQLDDNSREGLTLERIIEKGKTYSLNELPKLLWITTGERVPDEKTFEKLKNARNSIQHFCIPTDIEDMRRLSLEFIYKNIDPLIYKHFNMYAIEYHEDHSVSYDYLVACLIHHEILFSIPDDFEVTEIDLVEIINSTSKKYQSDLKLRFTEKGLGHLI